jgi:ArsR family transcriptional regulator
MADMNRCEVTQIHPETIFSLRQHQLSNGDVLGLSEIFKILGDPTRIRIMHFLSLQEVCVCDLAAVLEMSQSAVSHQLRILRNVRLAKFRKSGKTVYYSLDDEHISGLFAQGLEHVKHS